MRALEVFFQFLRLGCTSFGGPVAHLAYFRRTFVEQRAWLDDTAFGECVALTQLLPGPGSSQTAMLVGWLRAGPAGAFAAWVAFTLPSALLMWLCATAQYRLNGTAGWTHGLLLVATGVVASAIAGMRLSLAPDLVRIVIALAVALAALSLSNALVAPLAIGFSALAGIILLKGRIATTEPKLDLHISRRVAIVVLAAFALCFPALGIWSASGGHMATLVSTLFRTGSLVFGGGHVVLPLLQRQLANAGIITQRDLLSGYAAAQAIPGPLFTIASFAGARAYDGSLGASGALAGTIAIFAPSFFLLAGVAPFYRRLASSETFRCALAGANAGVLGLLGAAFVSPIFVTAIHSISDGLVALATFAALTFVGVPAWLIVILGAFAGYLLEK